MIVAALAVPVFSACVAGVARGVVLPPRHPAHSLRLDEHVHPACSGVHDDTATCLDESVAMLNAGRHGEGLGPLVLPRNWTRLTVPQQIYVLIELERTVRGLQPDTGLAADWNAAAQIGAAAGSDPVAGGSGAPGGFVSIWAGGQPNPIIATVGWIYDDAYFPDHTTQNIACSPSSPSGCWGHREAILRDTPATACGRRCAVGAGYSPTGFSGAGAGRGQESYAAVFGVRGVNNPDPLIFRWAAELRWLPACERTGDSCPWTAQPLITAHGAFNVRGLRQGASLVRPWFPVVYHGLASADGSVAVSFAVGRRLSTITVTARQGARRVALHVRRRGRESFEVTGRLGSGRWTLSISYGTPAIDGPRPSSTGTVRVP
ncbi:MAG: hypothetical protein KGL15_10970 [Acidobacteriota bacterium]|nr:hypothetical protein [Acidobacteriota bacterium]